MASKIQLRRGTFATLPTLSAGEPAFCTDIKKLYIGDGTKNIIINAGNTLVGVNVAAYGTSITWGQTIPNPPYHTAINWPKTFAEITGCNMFNNAVSGSCMAATGDSTNVNSFCNRVDTEDFSNYEYLFLEYGTNDYGYNIPIGKASDTVKTTFMGAMVYALNKLSTTYPNLKVVAMTPLFANVSYVKNPTTGHTMQDYANAVMEVATRFCIPIIDLHNGMGVNPKNITALYWDGALHPSESTYIRMGTFIAQSFPGEARRISQPVLWKKITLLNGASLTTPGLDFSYCIDSNQFVHFRGLVTITGTNTIFANLPVEARPNYSTTLPIANGSSIGIAVFTNGNILSPVATTYDMAGATPFYAGTPDVL